MVFTLEQTVIRIAPLLNDRCWPVVLGAGLMLHGLPHVADDLDIFVPDEYEARCLQAQLFLMGGNVKSEVAYSETEKYGGYISRMDFFGFPIEILGGFRQKHKDGWWHLHHHLQIDYKEVGHQNHPVPVASLYSLHKLYLRSPRHADGIKDDDRKASLLYHHINGLLEQGIIPSSIKYSKVKPAFV
ncbi:MAG: hypothetical protein NDI94_00695 [Candidatus Woesearchaeota archaeon]|nr:hypothetical protein [Candidatus Woesearchaeota archaeon]